MKTKPASGEKAWIDPDDAPRLTRSFFARAEIRDNDKIVRPARRATLRLDPDVVEALRAVGGDWQDKANAALRAAFSKRK